MDFETVIGLEVHIQLNTFSKAFAADRNEFNLVPNEHISAITLALPGTLPKANIAQVHKGMALALALDSTINEVNYFDRKNYFYPDLPKGYQITQDKKPIAVGGTFNFESDGQVKSIRIHHMHMEEDAGKSNHELSADYSLIEYNRAGTPLIELVTEPDFRSGQEVHDFLAAIQQLVQYLDISDGNMEEGSIRCDCNVSVRPIGQSAYGERCEVKNVNSKRFAKEAVTYEAQRQVAAILNGETITKTTMLFDPINGTTRPMRKKETENDYRYFPEPDLPPIKISQAQIASVKAAIDWLPWTMKEHLVQKGIVQDDANKIAESKSIATFFLDLLPKIDVAPKELASLFTNKIIPHSAATNTAIGEIISATRLNDFVQLYTSGKVSKSNALTVLWPNVIAQSTKNVADIATDLNLVIEANQDYLDPIVAEVMTANADKVKEYQSGKKGLLGFFMGQVKLKAGNNVNPNVLKEKVESILNNQ
jgi:aspartyl-tRNA(Asn)/glutamyl-tRNA(Gln) amidotransferase subunit B